MARAPSSCAVAVKLGPHKTTVVTVHTAMSVDDVLAIFDGVPRSAIVPRPGEILGARRGNRALVYAMPRTRDARAPVLDATVADDPQGSGSVITGTIRATRGYRWVGFPAAAFTVVAFVVVTAAAFLEDRSVVAGLLVASSLAVATIFVRVAVLRSMWMTTPYECEEALRRWLTQSFDAPVQ